jgi:hypothetical protein
LRFNYVLRASGVKRRGALGRERRARLAYSRTIHRAIVGKSVTHSASSSKKPAASRIVQPYQDEPAA